LENYAQAFEEFLQQIDFFEGLKERYPKDWMEREENVKELLKIPKRKGDGRIPLRGSFAGG
jgi:hypothetical protein